MTWTCKMVLWQHGTTDLDDLEVGSMWEYPVDQPKNDSDDSCMFRWNLKYLSQDYLTQRAALRHPLFVLMPSRNVFCIDTQTINGGVGSGGGWTVLGNAPELTLTPSINIGGSYHGYITNGIIGPDVDGRTYDEKGYKIRVP